MKKNTIIGGILGTIILAGALSFNTGCALFKTTTGSGTNTVTVINTNLVNDSAIIIKVAVSYGANQLIKKDPSSKQYLSLAANSIQVLILNKDVSPDSLNKALVAVSGVQDKDLQLLFSVIVDLYRNHYQTQVVKILGNDNALALKFLQSIVDGINLSVQ